MNKQIVIFDFDGVIVNTFEIYCNINRNIYPQLNLSDDDLRSFFDGSVFQSPVSKNLDRFFSLYGPEMLKLPLVDGMNECIEQLSRKYILVVISSSYSTLIRECLTKQNILNHFDQILGSDVEKSKIKKIQSITDKYRAGSQDMIMITDTLGDILEANKCNVSSIAVTWGYHNDSTLKKGDPYKIVNEPPELVKEIESYFKK